ncbi:hypothetical protein K4G81_24110, partial [Mycobacterium tuberculosis]|nr:hypothetical protein [Mycobacterium tuberculosis]
MSGQRRGGTRERGQQAASYSFAFPESGKLGTRGRRGVLPLAEIPIRYEELEKFCWLPLDRLEIDFILFIAAVAYA